MLGFHQDKQFFGVDEEEKTAIQEPVKVKF
jgi:hypothetical protein